jgi:hypothetical protein
MTRWWWRSPKVGDGGACSQELGKNSLCLVMVVRWLLNARGVLLKVDEVLFIGEVRWFITG